MLFPTATVSASGTGTVNDAKEISFRTTAAASFFTANFQAVQHLICQARFKLVPAAATQKALIKSTSGFPVRGFHSMIICLLGAAATQYQLAEVAFFINSGTTLNMNDNASNTTYQLLN